MSGAAGVVIFGDQVAIRGLVDSDDDLARGYSSAQGCERVRDAVKAGASEPPRL